MGLLGNGWDDPQSQGIMALAGGLLSGNFGQGVTGMGAAIQNGQDRILKRKLLDAELSMKQIAEQRAQQQFEMQRDAYNSIPGSASPAPGASPGGGAMSGGAMQPGGGDTNAQLMRLEKMAIAGVPGAKEAFELYKYRNDPQQLQPGTFSQNRVTGAREYIPDVKTGLGYDPAKGITQLSGSENIAALEGQKTAAQEREKAKLSLLPRDYVDPAGRPIGGSVLDYLGKQSAPTSPMPRIAASGYNGGSADAAKAEQIAIMQSELAKPGNSPADAEGIKREIARLQGGAPRLQSQAEAGQIKNATEAGGKVNDAWLKTSYEPVQASGQAAQALIDNTNVARTAMRAMGGTGWGTETKAAAMNVMAGLGIAPKNAEMYASNAQIFQRASMDRLWTMLNAAKGSQTEGDADRAGKTYGRLANTPQANEFIFDLAQATAEREKLKAAFFKNALPIAQQKGDLVEVERQWDRRAPSIFDMPTMNRWNKK